MISNIKRCIGYASIGGTILGGIFFILIHLERTREFRHSCWLSSNQFSLSAEERRDQDWNRDGIVDVRWIDAKRWELRYADRWISVRSPTEVHIRCEPAQTPGHGTRQQVFLITADDGKRYRLAEEDTSFSRDTFWVYPFRALLSFDRGK